MKVRLQELRDGLEDAQFTIRALVHYGILVRDGAAPEVCARHFWRRLTEDVPQVLSRVLRMLEKACERRRRRLKERSRQLRARVLQLELPL